MVRPHFIFVVVDIAEVPGHANQNTEVFKLYVHILQCCLFVIAFGGCNSEVNQRGKGIAYILGENMAFRFWEEHYSLMGILIQFFQLCQDLQTVQCHKKAPFEAGGKVSSEGGTDKGYSGPARISGGK